MSYLMGLHVLTAQKVQSVFTGIGISLGPGARNPGELWSLHHLRLSLPECVDSGALLAI